MIKKTVVLTLLLCHINLLPCYSETLSIPETTKASITKLDDAHSAKETESDDFDHFLAEFGDETLTMDDIDLSTIDKFSEDPIFLDKMSFAIQFFKIKCNNSWKTARTHILQNKELYVIGTITTATLIVTIMMISLLRKKN
jgi:hypothetical protein